jgi:hypothetical protein
MEDGDGDGFRLFDISREFDIFIAFKGLFLLESLGNCNFLLKKMDF